jgi:hypothetical protein
VGRPVIGGAQRTMTKRGSVKLMDGAGRRAGMICGPSTSSSAATVGETPEPVAMKYSSFGPMGSPTREFAAPVVAKIVIALPGWRLMPINLSVQIHSPAADEME